jgi:hypothetical protein
VALAGCSSLLELDQLEKVDCTDDCSEPGGSSTGSTSSAAASPSHAGRGGSATGGLPSGGAAGVSSSGSGAIMTGGSAGTSAEAGTAGSAGQTNTGPCPGGEAPPETWQEHWFEHDQLLTLAGYDDCVAVYVDAEMDPADTTRLQDFVSRAWEYNLQNYGALDQNRLFAIFHSGKYQGGHMVPYYETTHDSRSVIDGGRNVWPEDDFDLPAHLLSFAVESLGGHAKHGSPASWIWQDDAFAEIYKYDLYLGLGMQQQAAAAFDAFEPHAHRHPFPASYWFADFYYPIWRDHGETQVLVRFFELLREHYPVEGGVMPDMTWGEFIHFLSGAAGVNVEVQATYAFGWTSQWTVELEQARSDYPAISYAP